MTTRGHMRRAQAGLTLIEVLIAMAIFAFMMAMAWTTMSSSSTSKKRFEAVQVRNHEIRVAMNMMVRDISAAYLSGHEVSTGTDNPRTLFVGKDDSPVDELRFSSLSHLVMWADSNESEQTLITYLAEPDPDDSSRMNLVRRESRRLSNQPWESEPAEIDVLLRDIERVDFEYFDWRDNEWDKDWDTTKADAKPNRLPERVRITVTFQNERGDELKRTTQARIMMLEKYQFRQ